MNAKLRGVVIASLLPSLGCVLVVRDTEHLGDELIELVEAREDQVLECYEAHLLDAQKNIESRERARQGPYADTRPAVSSSIAAEGGTVVLRFAVTRKTGEVRQARAIDAHTDAPAALVDCALASLENLTLDPPDQRDADVTFAWRFRVGKPSKTRPPGMEGSEDAN